ncbi:Subtilisin-like protease SBT6.1 [Sesamum angolense]|uniref:Subtilisin-like protease SBT6.1 n=1 Tax=Sesamum angolense TaxID=2727404 RepID=A0AAE1WPF9_9LAMI|nr:Subtilisin-like protease SBT6.1 [Sesamum angolense]
MTRRFTCQISIFALSFLILLLSFFVNQILYPYTRNSTSPVSSPEETAPRNHIIRFFHYKQAQDLREYLERNVKSNGWKWVERYNPAMKFPTDFALVSIEERLKEFLVGEFEKLELVKDVSLDISYQRGVLEEKAVGAFVDGKKRPGKIFTAMSFGEGENSTATVANTSGVRISWRRNLMMQVSFL